MALFEKKYCDFCGNKIGMFSEKKLKNGSMCKPCSLKLSPYYNYGITTTIEQIQAHMIYREKNKAELQDFNPTLELGMDYSFYFDYEKKVFTISPSNKNNNHWNNVNVDLIPFSQITGCTYRIDEVKTEIKTKDSEGNTVSFVPAQYSYSYNYVIKVSVNNPFFRGFEKCINSSSIDSKNTLAMDKHRHCCDEIVKAMAAAAKYQAPPQAAPQKSQPAPKIPQPDTQAPQTQQAPKPRLFCAECGERLPNAGKFCPFCGTKF